MASKSVGGGATQTASPAQAVLGLVDHSRNCQPQFLPRRPALPLQNSLLRQGEGGLRGGLIPAHPSPPIDPTRP